MVAQVPFGDLRAANDAARAWCAEVNGVTHSEICAVPAERMLTERELLGPLPSLRASIGKMTTRKGRPAVVRPFRISALLRPRPADRHRGQAPGRRRPAAGHHDQRRGGRG
jgi:hypothetical protein